MLKYYITVYVRVAFLSVYHFNADTNAVKLKTIESVALKLNEISLHAEPVPGKYSSEDDVHVVFSTDCTFYQVFLHQLFASHVYTVFIHTLKMMYINAYILMLLVQDWQSLLVFYSATQVKQQGFITRIASGCDDDKQKLLTDLYNKLYPSEQFKVHFTPDYKLGPKNGSFRFKCACIYMQTHTHIVIPKKIMDIC